MQGESVVAQLHDLRDNHALKVHEGGDGPGKGGADDDDILYDECPDQQQRVNTEALHERVDILILAILHACQRRKQDAHNAADAQAKNMFNGQKEGKLPLLLS